MKSKPTKYRLTCGKGSALPLDPNLTKPVEGRKERRKEEEGEKENLERETPPSL